jgi:HIV Tat-specific factor 1
LAPQHCKTCNNKADVEQCLKVLHSDQRYGINCGCQCNELVRSKLYNYIMKDIESQEYQPNTSNNSEVIENDGLSNSDGATILFDEQLNKLHYYQSNLSGAISATPLTTRQLCLMLSPSLAAVNNNAHAAPSVVTPDTLAIGWNTESQSYSATWLPCRLIPILREACSNWHYQDSTTGEIRGPVTARVLASMLSTSSTTTTISTNEDDCVKSFPFLDKNTKVWSAEIAAQEYTYDESKSLTTTQWRRIADDPYLRIALHAFSNLNKSLQQAQDAKNDIIIDNQVFYPGDMVQSEDSQHFSDADNQRQKKIHQELAEILAQGDVEVEEEYESDGGTYYVRDNQFSEWRTEEPDSSRTTSRAAALKTTDEASILHHQQQINTNKKRKHHKAKFSAKNAAKWIYVTGLPKDTDEEEVERHFSRAGIIDLDPETQHPKIKLYRNKEGEGPLGELKGDASICYAREESVELAVRILDEGCFRPTAKHSEERFPLTITPAKFEKKGDVILQVTKPKVAEAKRKVAKLAAKQAIGWDEGDNGRITGGLKGLRIVVLKHLFTPSTLQSDDTILDQLEKQIRKECSELGDVEKITVFSKNPQGVILVKFVQPAAATEAVKLYNGRKWDQNKIDASYWDGITDFTVHDDEADDTEQRVEAFGQWLENQELPEEFKLKVEN